MHRASNRRQPLLQRQPSKLATSVGEVVGGTAAECVAVCCCVPCGVANFLVLAIYKLPAALCRRMLRQRRHRKIAKEGLLRPTRRHCSCGCCEDVTGRIFPMCANDAFDVERLHSPEPDSDDDTLALEKEMWDRFYNTGFWRSSSNRERREPSQTQTQLQLQLQNVVPQPNVFSWTLPLQQVHTQLVCAIFFIHVNETATLPFRFFKNIFLLCIAFSGGAFQVVWKFVPGFVCVKYCQLSDDGAQDFPLPLGNCCFKFLIELAAIEIYFHCSLQKNKKKWISYCSTVLYTPSSFFLHWFAEVTHFNLICLIICKDQVDVFIRLTS